VHVICSYRQCSAILLSHGICQDFNCSTLRRFYVLVIKFAYVLESACRLDMIAWRVRADSSRDPSNQFFRVEDGLSCGVLRRVSSRYKVRLRIGERVQTRYDCVESVCRLFTGPTQSVFPSRRWAFIWRVTPCDAVDGVKFVRSSGSLCEALPGGQNAKLVGL
jgi:hypothetical protein